MVIEVFVSQRNCIDALQHQLRHAVFYARWIAVIDEIVSRAYLDIRAVTPMHLSTSRNSTPPASELLHPPSNRPMTERRPSA